MQGDGHKVEKDFLEAMDYLLSVGIPKMVIPQRTSSDRTLHWHWMELYHFYLLHGSSHRSGTTLCWYWMEVYNTFICYMGHLTHQGPHCAGTGFVMFLNKYRHKLCTNENIKINTCLIITMYQH